MVAWICSFLLLVYSVGPIVCLKHLQTIFYGLQAPCVMKDKISVTLTNRRFGSEQIALLPKGTSNKLKTSCLFCFGCLGSRCECPRLTSTKTWSGRSLVAQKVL